MVNVNYRVANQRYVNQPYTNQSDANQSDSNQSDATQPYTNQPNATQYYTNQSDANQSDANQPVVNQKSMIKRYSAKKGILQIAEKQNKAQNKYEMTKEKMKLWTNLKKMRYNKGKETFQRISELYKYKWKEFLDKNLLTKLGFNSINIEINNDYIINIKDKINNEMLPKLRSFDNRLKKTPGFFTQQLTEEDFKYFKDINLLCRFNFNFKKFRNEFNIGIRIISQRRDLYLNYINELIRELEYILTLNELTFINNIKLNIYETLFKFLYYQNYAYINGKNNSSLSHYIYEEFYYGELLNIFKNIIKITQVNNNNLLPNRLQQKNNLNNENILSKGAHGIVFNNENSKVIKIQAVEEILRCFTEYVINCYLYQIDFPNIKPIPEASDFKIGHNYVSYKSKKIDGITLRAFFLSEIYNNLTEEDKITVTKNILINIAKILEFYQDYCYFIHGDIHSGNIMIKYNSINDFNIYLIDFGNSIMRIREIGLFIFRITSFMKERDILKHEEGMFDELKGTKKITIHSITYNFLNDRSFAFSCDLFFLTCIIILFNNYEGLIIPTNFTEYLLYKLYFLKELPNKKKNTYNLYKHIKDRVKYLPYSKEFRHRFYTKYLQNSKNILTYPINFFNKNNLKRDFMIKLNNNFNPKNFIIFINEFKSINH
jgi:hypothetical protein